MSATAKGSPPFDPTRLPAQLIEAANWLLRRAVGRKGLTLWNARHEKANLADSRTWSPFVDALTTLRKIPDAFDGLSIALGELGDGDFRIALLLRGCIDDAGGVSEWAALVLKTADT